MPFLLVLISFLLPANKTLNEIRSLYHESIYSSEKSKEIINYFDKEPGKTATEMAYEGASRMVRAKHLFFPHDKLSTFQKGKVLVEEAVKKEPNGIEIRYLRYSLQLESPSFLSYRQNLSEDRKFLIEHYSEVRDKELKLRLKDFLIKEAKLSIEERKIIN
ncbi:MAG: hypothetical protein ACOVO9_05205 [Bacteroidia bacterium]